MQCNAVQCSGVHCIVMHFTPLTPECESQTDAIGVGSSWVGPRTNGSLPSLWALRLSLAKPNMVWLTRCPRVGRLTPALGSISSFRNCSWFLHKVLVIYSFSLKCNQHFCPGGKVKKMMFGENLKFGCYHCFYDQIEKYL